MNRGIIQAVDHIHLTAPRSAIEALRWFYGELVDLEESTASHPQPRWLDFSSGRIHLIIELLHDSVQIDPIPTRATFLVQSLSAVRRQLDERGIAYESFTGMSWSDRSLALIDPAGYRVVLRQDGSVFGL